MISRRISIVVLVLLALLAQPVRAQDPTTTGTLTAAGATVVVNLANVPSVAVQLSGSDGLVAFDATVDGGATWWPLGARSVADGSVVFVSPINGLYLVQNAGYTHMRVRSVNYAGTVSVTATRGFNLGPLPTVLAGVGPNALPRSLAVTAAGEVQTTTPARLPLPFCNALLRYNCQVKGF